MKDTMNTLALVGAIGLSILLMAFIILQFSIESTTSPVEEISNVDTLIKSNDSIKLKINKIDSIKDAKVIEVYSISNDSTVKLFYELVKK